MRSAGVRRLVYVSSVKAMGERSRGAALRPQDDRRPEDAYGQSKAEAEDAVLTACADGLIEAAIVRPVLCLGRGRRGICSGCWGRSRGAGPCPWAACATAAAWWGGKPGLLPADGGDCTPRGPGPDRGPALPCLPPRGRRGTQVLIAAMRSAGVRRLVYVSSINALSERSTGIPLRPDDARHPADPYGQGRPRRKMPYWRPMPMGTSTPSSSVSCWCMGQVPSRSG